MTNEIVRSNRLRKKLYLDEFAILGFEFTCKVSMESESEYDAFFQRFAVLVEARNLYINLDGDADCFVGFVTSADRYGNATAEDKKAIENALSDNKMISDLSVGDLVDAFYGL
ncbi:MAG: hypothetical protein ACI9NY_001040 [Kiritimatiellia bacterium]|jgi:uncharacterized protein YggL (DUF469 family)